MEDQNTKLSKMAIASLILSFFVLLPGLGFLFLPIVAILIVISSVLLKRNPLLTGSKFLFASVFLCILGIFINFYIVSHPKVAYRLITRSTQGIITSSPESKDALMEQARKMEGGEELIKESTLSDGTVDTKKLLTLITNAGINKFDKIIDEGQRMREKRDESMKSMNLAFKYEEDKKYDLALEEFRKQIALFPDESSTYATRSRIYVKMQNYESALNDLSQALNLLQKEESEAVNKEQSQVQINSLKASKTVWLQNRGDIYRKLQKFDLALQDYSDAIANSADRQYSWLHFVRGLCYRKLGDLEKTKQDWQTALSLGLKLNDFNDHESDAEGTWNGKAVWYFPNGNVKTEGSYKNGKEDGVFKFYDEAGSSRGQRVYRDGVEIK